ncbi:hypothetical protein Lal_00039234 [Lupinus albus]|nr:hypothetical protein Lal_00039234 [Lupinus albus]
MGDGFGYEALTEEEAAMEDDGTKAKVHGSKGRHLSRMLHVIGEERFEELSTLRVEKEAGEEVTIPYHEGHVTILYHEWQVTTPYHEGQVTIPYHEWQVTIPYHEGRVTIPYHEGQVTIPYHEGQVTIPYHEGQVTIPIPRWAGHNSIPTYYPQP